MPGGAGRTGWSSSIKDVTEQRTAERALKESEARFRRIANSAPAMMWVTRLDRVRDFVNDAYVEFVGGPGAAARRRGRSTGAARIHPDDVERIVAESSPGKRRGSRSRSRGATSAGTASGAGFEACRSRASGPTGSWSGSSASATDITLAKEAELELRRQVEEQTRAAGGCREARFRAVFDTVLEVLVLMEPDGTVVELNRKEARVAGGERARGGRAQDVGRADARALPAARRR